MPTVDPPVRVRVHVLCPGDASRQGLLGASEPLSPDEQSRAARLRDPAQRDLWIQTRATLRVILAWHLGCSPREVAFRYSPHGKPTVAGGVEFNVSHADALALIAVSPRPVGVDVEPLAAASRVREVAGSFFSPACVVQAESAGALRDERLVALWVGTEALLKAQGGSIADAAVAARQIERVVTNAGFVLDRPIPIGPAWDILWWRPAPGYLAAVVGARGMQVEQVDKER